MDDVLIVGAGPAGTVAGLVLARAGARVRIVDRATFPRDKLCGDTVNPGTLAVLRRLGVADFVEGCGLRVDGMVVTGDSGTAIVGRYPADLYGRALLRRDLDWILLQQAVQAGCTFESGVPVREPIVSSTRSGPTVRGVFSSRHGTTRDLRAHVTIAADGRRSSLAFSLGLSTHPRRPRRWAIGAYFTDVAPLDDITARRATDTGETAARPSSRSLPSIFGEMHIRSDRYIGVAPVPNGLVNVCLVKPSWAGDADLRDPASLLRRELAHDPLLRQRFASAQLVRPPVTLGPLAVDVTPAGMEGMLLAGDAAGFIDPMTGDGLRFAIRGGEMAAVAALEALKHGWTGVHARLDAQRRREFAPKWRFNRALRSLVGSPRAIGAATFGARLAPSILRAVIARAGDCDIADRALS